MNNLEPQEPIIKIEGHSDLIRCPKSGAILSTATSEYNRFVNNKQKEKNQQEKIQTLESELNELKRLVKQLLNDSTSTTSK